MKKIKFIIYNIILVTVLFLLTELSVRLFYPSIQTKGTSKNLLVDKFYFYSPGLRNNAIGESNGVIKIVNQNRFWKYNKKDISNNIILYLGDSVTMGLGVENDSTFAGRINNYHKNVSIINPSLIGYSHKDYLNLVKHFIINQQNSLQISEVNVFWCLNDVYSELPEMDSPELNFGNFIDEVVIFFRRNSKLYHFLKKNFSDRPKSYYLFDKQFYSLSDPNYKSAIESLKFINTILSKMNIDFKVILLPYEFELRNEFDVSKSPQSLLSQSLSSIGIRVFDLLPMILEKHIPPEDLYLYGDGIHFSNKGHKLIADIMSKKIYVQ